MDPSQQTPVLELKGVSKSFGAVVALRNADLALYAGSIHALVGENGAGKSTVVKIMAGLYQRDSGTFAMDGEPVHFRNTAEAKAAGIAVIYQEPTLFPDLSVTENVFMGKELAASHPNIKLVDTVYGNDDDQDSFDKTSGLLSAHPNLKGIISPTTVGIAAAARYLSKSDAKGKVALTGLGTPNQLREYVKDGTVKEFALWNPQDLGTLATYAAASLARGEITGKEGDKFKAGDLGEFTVGADATVLLGEPYKFNKGNIDKFDF